MKKRIIIVYSTHLSELENENFEKHINKTCGVPVSIHNFPNFNEYSLTEIYNNAIREISSENAITVFCHNDIEFDTPNWGKILLKHFNNPNNNYQILGVAGTTELNEHGTWWLNQSSEMNFSKMIGIVNHDNGIRKWESKYSEPHFGIKPVLLVDGLFMAVDTEDIEHKFDESYRGFHFYDVSFCIPNYLDGCNIGVITDIRITHKSIGLTNNQWDINRQQFVDEYNIELPIKLDLTDHYKAPLENKLKVLICCQFFNNYTGSEVSNYELGKELVNQGCDVTLVSTMIGDPILSKANKAGIKVLNINNLPDENFDILHINHKPIGKEILKKYPNTPAIMHVRSEVIPVFEEPIIHPNIKKYISIRDSITKYIKSFGISENLIETVDNPFDSKRFNTAYNKKNIKNSVLFVGTLDHLRKNILFDLVNITKKDNQELWIIGSNSGRYVNELLKFDHVKYYGVVSDPEKYIKRCKYTAGIFKGRTTIEGFLCGKDGLIYEVDKQGNILTKKYYEVPKDIKKYYSNNSAKKIIDLYKRILNE